MAEKGDFTAQDQCNASSDYSHGFFSGHRKHEIRDIPINSRYIHTATHDYSDEKKSNNITEVSVSMLPIHIQDDTSPMGQRRMTQSNSERKLVSDYRLQ